MTRESLVAMRCVGIYASAEVATLEHLEHFATWSSYKVRGSHAITTRGSWKPEDTMPATVP